MGQGDQAGSAPRPRNEPSRRLDQLKKQQKQLKIASINMNGRGSRPQDKWGSINNILRRKIVVLALQEIHPNGDL